jgi:uncharacterized protein YjbJ (UPF0337 family)
MSDEIRNKDDAKGRVKEAAGDLTGVENAADKVKDALKRD